MRRLARANWIFDELDLKLMATAECLLVVEEPTAFMLWCIDSRCMNLAYGDLSFL